MASNGSCGFPLEQSGVLLGHFPWLCDPWICSNQGWFETILEILQAKQYTATNPFLFKSVRMDSVPWIQQPGNTNTDSSMALINVPDPYFLGWFPTSCLRTHLLQSFQTGLMESHSLTMLVTHLEALIVLILNSSSATADSKNLGKSLNISFTYSSFAEWGQQCCQPQMVVVRISWDNIREAHATVPGTWERHDT